MIGAWMCTSRRKLNGRNSCRFETVEAAAVVVGMRHDRAGEDLQQQHRRDHEEVFADLALAVGQRPKRASTGSIGASSGSFSQNS